MTERISLHFFATSGGARVYYARIVRQLGPCTALHRSVLLSRLTPEQRRVALSLPPCESEAR